MSAWSRMYAVGRIACVSTWEAATSALTHRVRPTINGILFWGTFHFLIPDMLLGTLSLTNLSLVYSHVELTGNQYCVGMQPVPSINGQEMNSLGSSLCKPNHHLWLPSLPTTESQCGIQGSPTTSNALWCWEPAFLLKIPHSFVLPQAGKYCQQVNGSKKYFFCCYGDSPWSKRWEKHGWVDSLPIDDVFLTNAGVWQSSWYWINCSNFFSMPSR